MRTLTLPTHLMWSALSVLLGVASAGANSDRPDRDPLVAGLLGVAAAGMAQLALARPRLALVLCGLVTAVFHSVGYDDGPLPLALPAAGFVAALSLRPRRQWPALAVACALVTAGLAILGSRTDTLTGTVWRAGGSVLLAVAASAAGWWWSAREEARRERTTRVATEEQLRMARDLHDGVGHGLAVIAMQAGVALHVLDSDREAARRALQAIRDSSTESLVSRV